MVSFGNKNKVKRPKFLFNLHINELVNIPQSSGYCFVKWNFKEGTSGTNIINDTNIQISSQNKGLTHHIPIKHHRVQWNYSFPRPVLIKLQVDKNKNIVPRFITFEVYLESTTQLSCNQRVSGKTRDDNTEFPLSPILSHKSSILRTPSLKSSKSFDLKIYDPKIDGVNSNITTTNNNNNNNKSSLLGSNIYPQRITGKTFLGRIEVNVAEYIRENEEPITNRFLLKDSKVNSILNVTFQLKLIRGSYNDFNIPSVFTTGQLSGPFQNGLPNLLDSSISDLSSTPTTSTFTTHNNNNNSSGRPKLFIPTSTQPSIKSNSYSLKSNGLSTISSSMTPLIDSLYEKTFKLPWDERPNEYTPRECIEDILKGGNGWAKNENGVPLIDLQALKLKNIESEYYLSNNKNNDDNNSNNNNNNNNNNNQGQRRKFSFATNKEDEKYWNNMDNREYLERKNQHLFDQNLSIDNSVFKNNYYSNSNEYSINFNDKNEPYDQILRNTKSWSVKKTDL